MAKLSLSSKIPKKRIAVIDKELCTKEECGYLCVKICPVNRSKKECIKLDQDGYPVIDEGLCIGCGLCVPKCPNDAIRIINLDYEFNRTVHSFGVNSFRIYSLPLPKEGAVVGFLGKNGIGKTTILNILSKKLVPNFDKNVQNWEDAYKHMTNIERSFFSNNKKISIKPQNIEIFRNSNITLGQLLSELSLNLPSFDHLLHRRLDQLSGGELQTLLIEIALNQKAQLYYIDEPTNFLDIHQRLKYAIRIREVLEGKDVIIIDHDIAFLDYVADYLYLFVGEEDVFGFSSEIRNTRNGINEYLEGFLKTENYRFREEIRFDDYSETEHSNSVLIEYEDMDIKIGDFSLKVHKGDIRIGEILGILGRNGIGKTTFISKIVNMYDNLRLAYKPQYIIPSDQFVKDLNINNNLIEMFNIRRSIMDRKLNQLSGGQLQKVYIAYTLSKDADIYLLDEPTAYLDIENRIRLIKILRKYASEKQKSILVIDHDIMFMDRLAHRLIVFDGDPGRYGIGSSPMDKIEGMNRFLSILNITMRRDPDSRRPRINKPGSVLDREQRISGKFYS